MQRNIYVPKPTIFQSLYQIMPKIAFCFFMLALVTINSSQGGELDVDLTGLSYHIGGGRRKPAYEDAPRRLDKYGVFVFNPGVGIGYDFRTRSTKRGLSCATKLVYFRDCDDRGFFMGGGGARYRLTFGKYFSTDLDALAMVSAGQEWDSSKYNFSVLPLIMLGGNYHFANEITVGTNFTVAPKNTSFSATGGFWILFTTLQVSFPILVSKKAKAT